MEGTDPTPPIPAECFVCHRVLEGFLYVPGEHLAHAECLDAIMHGPGIDPAIREGYDEATEGAEKEESSP